MEAVAGTIVAEIAPDELGYFRWGSVAGRILVSSDGGDWASLSSEEFADLASGKVTAGHPRFEEFQRKGFLRDGLDLDALAARVSRRTRHIHRGPVLHVVNLESVCPAEDPEGNDTAAKIVMSADTFGHVVELALQSNANSITFEFQADGGEPLRLFPSLQEFVDAARARNKRMAGKTLHFRVLSNLSAMTEEIADWLIANQIEVCTTLDGPADLHDANLSWRGGSRHEDVVRWIELFHRKNPKADAPVGIEARVTVTRSTLSRAKDVVAEYVQRGLGTIVLRPLHGAGLPSAVWSEVGYTAEDYLAFYRQALEAVLAQNRGGSRLRERMAEVFAARILPGQESNVVDVQSPDGAGLSQLAYRADGLVFPSDEALSVSLSGDSMFELGRVDTLSLPDVLQHPTVRAIAAASLLDLQPMCADCWNKPFCGISPVFNYRTQGDLVGQRPRSLKCKEHMAVAGRVFEILSDEQDPTGAGILRDWAANGEASGTAWRASAAIPGQSSF